MKLVCKKSNNEKRDITEVQNEEQAINEIKKFCHNKNYDIPYISVSYHTNVIIYDVGSHTQFFYLYLENDDEE